MQRLASFFALSLLTAVGVQAEPVKNPVAVFTGLDKITGTTTNFEANVGEAKPFGGLTVKADVCYTRPITEEPNTAAFVEITAPEADGKQQRKLFSGWMFAQSPGLNALENPVYDVWLVNCRDPKAPPPPVEAPQEPAPDAEKDKQNQPED